MREGASTNPGVDFDRP